MTLTEAIAEIHAAYKHAKAVSEKTGTPLVSKTIFMGEQMAYQTCLEILKKVK